MLDTLKKLSALQVFLLTAGFSAASLIMALIAQFGFNLAPCELCIYQRWPFGLIIVLGIFGLMVSKGGMPALARLTVAMTGLTFLTNAGIAVFHSGVERHWWKGLEGCSAPDLSGNIDDVLARIAATPAAKCDEIPWADPILGLSMANYNVLFCGVAGLLCLIWVLKNPAVYKTN
ncbi:MAG: disulfide bond formation protein B [Pseudobdellovibrionaceae bacterium]